MKLTELPVTRLTGPAGTLRIWEEVDDAGRSLYAGV